MADRPPRPVQPFAAVFASHEEAEAAELRYYWSLTPRERIQILLELNDLWIGKDDASPPSGPARVRRSAEQA